MDSLPTLPAVPNLEGKLARLREVLGALPSALVAYSGGVDSAFLLSVAVETLGARAIALTARSASMPSEELVAARALAARLGAVHLEIDSHELEDPRYAANPSNRCFYCKSELFLRASEEAARLRAERGSDVVVLDGTNVDDLFDHRPGRAAAERAGVRSPLVEAGLRKDEIRSLSRARGLPTWDKPSAPCLASRIPYGTAVTAERLGTVERAERAVRAHGFRSFRVRHHESVARLEIDAAELPRLLGDPALRDALARDVKAAGYAFVSVDLEPLKSGRLNVLAAT